MDHTYVDEKNLKSLEDLAIFLTTSIASLITLQNVQVRAIEIGIMKEDMNERSNTMIWDLRRLINQYTTQLSEVLELVPDDFQPVEAILKLQKTHMKKFKNISKENRVIKQ